VDGVAEPKELAHSKMASAWLRRFDVDPSDEQLIAARAHHLRRWDIPRTDYPDGRAGYLRWRRDLGARHRDDVEAIMGDAGYDDSAIARTAAIMAKRDLDRDPAVQAHEDALCMVFLETQLDQLCDRLGDEKAAEVVAKTLGKMSPAGITAALSVRFSDPGGAVVAAAVELAEGEV